MEETENFEDLSSAPNLRDLSKQAEVAATKKPSSFWKKVKWFFVLALILAIGIFLASTIGVNKLRSMRAETEVTKFVKALYPNEQVLGKICQGEDTDQDSYVSCAVTIASRQNPLSVQCPTLIKSFMGTSCRLTPGVSPVNV